MLALSLRYCILPSIFSNLTSSDSYLIFMAKERPLTQMFTLVLQKEEYNTFLFSLFLKVWKKQSARVKRTFPDFCLPLTYQYRWKDILYPVMKTLRRFWQTSDKEDVLPTSFPNLKVQCYVRALHIFHILQTPTNCQIRKLPKQDMFGSLHVSIWYTAKLHFKLLNGPAAMMFVTPAMFISLPLFCSSFPLVSLGRKTNLSWTYVKCSITNSLL